MTYDSHLSPWEVCYQLTFVGAMLYFSQLPHSCFVISQRQTLEISALSGQFVGTNSCNASASQSCLLFLWTSYKPIGLLPISSSYYRIPRLHMHNAIPDAVYSLPIHDMWHFWRMNPIGLYCLYHSETFARNRLIHNNASNFQYIGSRLLKCSATCTL